MVSPWSTPSEMDAVLGSDQTKRSWWANLWSYRGLEQYNEEDRWGTVRKIDTVWMCGTVITYQRYLGREDAEVAPEVLRVDILKTGARFQELQEQ